MKIQPTDQPPTTDQVKLPAKSRFKRLFERPFSSSARSSSTERLASAGLDQSHSDAEQSSVCLAKLVDSYIEGSNEKLNSKGRQTRCNCFNGSYTDSSDDESDFSASYSDSSVAAEVLKGLVPCASLAERNLLADTARIVDRGKICKRKDDCRSSVVDGLLALGYDASMCKSRWEKCTSFPSGEYEYVDVVINGERILIDVDFRSEFKIARSTKMYRAVLQCLPPIFVGKTDRLQQIIAIVSDAAKRSLKKKGLHIPPWRKPEYVRAKWLSSYERIVTKRDTVGASEACTISTQIFSGEFEIQLCEKPEPGEHEASEYGEVAGGGEQKIKIVVSPWLPPAIKPKASQKVVVTGLASILLDKP